jgi:hypothetical protein
MKTKITMKKEQLKRYVTEHVLRDNIKPVELQALLHAVFPSALPGEIVEALVEIVREQDKQIKEMVTVNTWPESQICMDCDHGCFITGEDYGDSDYICSIGQRPGSEACPTRDDENETEE